MEHRDGIDGEPKPAAKLGARLAEAALPLLGALFLGAITVGVLGARVSGPAIFDILLRAFFGLLVGGLALWMAVGAIQALAGAQRQATAPGETPASIRVLCPACGRLAPDAQWCPACELPQGDRSKAWRAEDQSRGTDLLLLCMGAGLLSLGIFVGLGPLLEGERRLWAAIAFVALGLLIGGVGVLILWGGGLIIRDKLRGIRRWSYSSELTRPGASYSVSSTAILARARLVHASGNASVTVALGALRGMRQPASLAPAEQAFARALSFLHQRGHLALWWNRTIDWRLGAPVEVSVFRPLATAPTAPEAETAMKLQLLMQRLASPPDDAARELLESLAPMLDGVKPVAAVWRTCRESGMASFPLPADPAAASQACQVAEQAVATELCGEHLN